MRRKSTFVSFFSLASVTCVAFFLGSCGKEKKSQVMVLSEIPGFHPKKPVLGKAFDSVTGQVLNQNCVTGTTQNVGNTIGEVKYLRNMSYSDLLSQFSAGMSATLPEWAGFKAGLSYASENKASELVDTHSIFLNATPKSLVYQTDSLELTNEAQAILNSERASELHAFCGDEYISQLDLGATLIATLKVKFASQEDRREFNSNADIRIGISETSVDVSGNFQKLSESVRANTRISIQALQHGGTPSELFSILPEQTIVCTLSDLTPCLNIFQNVINYAKSGFKTQLETPENYNVIRAVTLPYKDSSAGVWALRVQTGSAENTLRFEQEMDTLRNIFESQSRWNAQAQEILMTLENELTTNETAKLNHIVLMTTQNIRALEFKLAACRAQPDIHCAPESSALKKFSLAPLESKYARQVSLTSFNQDSNNWSFDSNHYRTVSPVVVNSTFAQKISLPKDHLAFGISEDGFFCMNNQVILKISEKIYLKEKSMLSIELEGFAEKCNSCDGSRHLELNGTPVFELPSGNAQSAKAVILGEAGENEIAIVSSTKKLCQDSQYLYLNSLRIERLLRP